MTFITRLIPLFLFFSALCFAQPHEAAEEVKLAMLEALVAAPPERALPIVERILRDAQASAELKERALFVLSHIDTAAAESLLVDVAKNDDGLRREAIRAIGIKGSAGALAALTDLYRTGSDDVRRSVLEAYLIADDTRAVYELALEATTEEEFSNAVQTLGAMGALDELRALRESAQWTDSLVRAYAIAGDTETLLELARDDSDPEQQVRAINGLAVAGGDDAADVVLELYRNTADASVREAALEALMIGNADEQVLSLFRNSTDSKEQRRLLELLVIMDSDAVWEVIDTTLQD